MPNNITDSANETLAAMVLRAKRSAFKRAVDMAKTATSASIRQSYNISKSDLDKTLYISRINYDDCTGEITVTSKGLGLRLFKAYEVKAGRTLRMIGKRGDRKIKTSNNRYSNAGGVLAQVRKDQPFHAYRSDDGSRKAFLATMKNGHVGVFIRTGEPSARNPKKEKIVELFGPSVFNLMSKEDLPARQMLQNTFFDAFDKRLDHELGRRFSSEG
jgi:hypothetical protein